MTPIINVLALKSCETRGTRMGNYVMTVWQAASVYRTASSGDFRKISTSIDTDAEENYLGGNREIGKDNENGDFARCTCIHNRPFIACLLAPKTARRS
jgi:hypothetical protein